MKIVVKFVGEREGSQEKKPFHYGIAFATAPSLYERWPGECPVVGDPFALDCDESACGGEKQIPLDPTGRHIAHPAPLQ